jgi:Mg/Co/Ni transporter MgtE
MSEPDWYVISDLSDFTDKARSIVYNNYGSWDNESDVEDLMDDVAETEREDFDKMLSHQECLVIVKENIKRERNKKNRKVRYILNDEIFVEIITKLNDRLTSNIMSSLVQKGLVETAFDEKENDFVFWIADNEDKNQVEKPETD